jgi:hypothetical protein
MVFDVDKRTGGVKPLRVLNFVSNSIDVLDVYADRDPIDGVRSSSGL